MSKKNLVPLGNRSPTERREIARKGAMAANEVRRRKRDLRELLQAVITAPVPDKKIKEELSKLGVDDTYGGLMIFKAVQNAGKNPAMFRNILELAGYPLGAKAADNLLEAKVQIYLPDNERHNDDTTEGAD